MTRPQNAERQRLLMVSGVRFDFLTQRPQHLARELAEDYEVYFVEPPVSVGMIGLRPFRLLSHLLGTRMSSRVVADGLTVLTPVTKFPFPAKIAAARRANAQMMASALRNTLGSTESVVIWAMHPWAADLMDQLPGVSVVYDCLDDFAAFPNATDASIVLDVEREQTLLARADEVVATAEVLRERLSERATAEVTVVRNAADTSHFARAPRRMFDEGSPQAAYVGAIAGWFDFDAVRNLAAGHPNLQVKLFGPLLGLEAPMLPDNVRLEGPVDYEDLPRILGDIDIALIPFRLDALTEATNPIKVYEYLAAGRRVLSTPLPEVRLIGDLVTVAESSEWAAAAAGLLGQVPAEEDEARRSWAASQSWRARADQAREVIERASRRAQHD